MELQRAQGRPFVRLVVAWEVSLFFFSPNRCVVCVSTPCATSRHVNVYVCVNVHVCEPMGLDGICA